MPGNVYSTKKITKGSCFRGCLCVTELSVVHLYKSGTVNPKCIHRDRVDSD